MAAYDRMQLSARIVCPSRYCTQGTGRLQLAQLGIQLAKKGKTKPWLEFNLPAAPPYTHMNVRPDARASGLHVDDCMPAQCVPGLLAWEGAVALPQHSSAHQARGKPGRGGRGGVLRM